MRMSHTLLLAFISGILFVTPATAAAQSEPCLTKPDLAEAFSAKDVLQWAHAEAAKTDPDSALTRMLTTASVDARGRSTGWLVELWSASGKRLHDVVFDAGAMTCTTHALDGPFMATPVGETDATILDLTRLVGVAREASTPPPDLAALKVSASLQRNSPDSAAQWSISFVDGQGYPKGQVTIDSMTGAVIR
jgi:hypothetical protein